MSSDNDDPFAVIEVAANRQVAEEQAAKALASARVNLILGRDAKSAFFATLVLRLTPEPNWDIDTVGNGTTGTANWAAATGPNTYVQASVGNDSVIFDDTVGAGPTNVNLTTTISPTSVSLNNSSANYTWSGAGKLSGDAGVDGFLVAVIGWHGSAKNGRQEFVVGDFLQFGNHHAARRLQNPERSTRPTRPRPPKCPAA